MGNDFTKRYLEIKRALFDKAFERLNPQQRLAVFTTRGPLLVIAGAGSGKTSVLVNRISYLIKYGDAYFSERVPYMADEGNLKSLEKLLNRPAEEILPALTQFSDQCCPPYRILAFTFTNKAAGQIKTRLSEILQDEDAADAVWSGTFHVVCLRILRKYAKLAGYEPGFSIYDTEDSKKALLAIMKRLNIDDKKLPVKTVMNAISRQKERLQGPDDLSNDPSTTNDFVASNVRRIYPAYQAELHRANAVDFDDIIMQTVCLLRNYPEVLREYQNRFSYVLVDEYQDTNYAQFELTNLLAGGYGNLMVVGDDDQSIYRFRGATVENILTFDKYYENAKVIKLEQNYRSTATILSAANAVIGHNSQRHGKKLWTAGEKGEPIDLITTDSQPEEAQYIVDLIQKTVGTPHGEGKYKYSDFAVLYRVNAQSAPIEGALTKSGIPYRLLGGLRFYDRMEIRDTVAYLRLIVNPNDNAKLLRIINQPRRGIGNRTIEVAQQLAAENNTSLFDVIQHADSYPALSRPAGLLKDFAGLIRELIDYCHNGNASMSGLFTLIMDRTGYANMLKASPEDPTERLENLEALKANMMEYADENDDGQTDFLQLLSDYLEEVSLLAEIDGYRDDADAVVLMTVHSAKGLEFPIVILPGMEDGIFPGLQNLNGSQDDIEEERRLAYVAMTRARLRLVIIHAKSRIWYGQTVFNPVSKFVKEIPKRLVKEQEIHASAWKPNQTRYGGSTYGSAGTTVGRANSVTSSVSGASGVGRTSTVKPQVTQTFQPGDRVVSASFGTGVVISVKPMGKDVLLEVIFDSVGTKRLMASFARLKKD